MIKKIDHIGIAVKNVKEVADIFKDRLGFFLEKIETLRKDNTEYKFAFFPFSGVEIELIESSEKSGMNADFIRERGEGIHHIAFEVTDIYEIVDSIKKNGIEIFYGITEGSRGTKIAFIDPKYTKGIYIEFVQRTGLNQEP